ncbi:YhjD/YihY/BrkB family envelope integrity protein [Bradyrhizobium sp. AUGA SZCCT0182]|uniref:YhjD/YihY/BrkB family envelope integrity protein n=1 Tax=Bradyrhizobium sp. AUGA SZCCT0182 TaxID=2807667 RepID=UPI00390C850C
MQGWKDILWRTYHQINEDRLLAIAAGVVFYALLALFPGITALVSSYALIADATTINGHLGMLSGILPPGTFSVVQDQVGVCWRRAKLHWEQLFCSVSRWLCGAPMVAQKLSLMRST